MTKLLILTNSLDGTTDSLLHLTSSTTIECFRWNVDLWESYEIEASPSRFRIADPTGRCFDLLDQNIFLLWRKPFTELMSFDLEKFPKSDILIAKSQLKQWLYAVVALMTADGRAKLIEPFADQRLPKPYQLYLANNIFDVPRSIFSTHSPSDYLASEVITKMLGDPSDANGNVIYTSSVIQDELHRPFPWFLQEAFIGGTDVTCVHILGKNCLYECSFSRTETKLDWRTEINTDTQSSWRLLDIPDSHEIYKSINTYMGQSNLHYGRLDFIRLGNRIIFLECNPNGQFGWLDDASALTLHRRFLEAVLDPRSRIGSSSRKSPNLG